MTTVPPDTPTAYGDIKRLTQCLMNLAGNALKFTREGRVEIGVDVQGDTLLYHVSDSGIGIAPEDQQRILSGYYRTEAGKKAAKGFGVGLALSQALLAAHGTELKVESVPGQGARFSFVLPPAPPG